MKDFLTTIALGIIVIVAGLIFANLDAVNTGLAEAGHIFLIWLRWLLILTTALALITGGLILWVVWDKRRDLHRRAVDGSFRLQIFRRNGVDVIVDPNKMINGAGVYHPQFGWREFDPAGGWDRALQLAETVQTTRHLEALTPGDRALQHLPASLGKSGIANAATGRWLSGFYRKQQPQPATVDHQPSDADHRISELTLADAIHQAKGDRLILGHNDAGPCTIDLARDVHLAILGATGTGKTATVAMLSVIQALRSNWHVLILDPKGGMDWRAFDGPCEWHDTDYATFPEQLQTIHSEHQRRLELARRHNVPSVRGLSQELPPILVLIEEIGALRDSLQMAGERKKLQETDGVLNNLLRLSRASDIHLVLVDQYPEHWTGQMLANTKSKLIFRLGPNQGNKVGEYQAQNLPKQGVFLHDGHQYQTWHVAPQAPKLLQSATPAAERIIDAQRTPDNVRPERSVTRSEPVRPEVDTPPPPSPNTPNDETRAAIFAYLDRHPDASQADVRHALNFSKGYTHECWHAWHEARNAPSSEAETIPDARNGARTILDMNDPDQAEELARIRQELAHSNVTVG